MNIQRFFILPVLILALGMPMAAQGGEDQAGGPTRHEADSQSSHGAPARTAWLLLMMQLLFSASADPGAMASPTCPVEAAGPGEIGASASASHPLHGPTGSTLDGSAFRSEAEPFRDELDDLLTRQEHLTAPSHRVGAWSEKIALAARAYEQETDSSKVLKSFRDSIHREGRAPNPLDSEALTSIKKLDEGVRAAISAYRTPDQVENALQIRVKLKAARDRAADLTEVLTRNQINSKIQEFEIERGQEQLDLLILQHWQEPGQAPAAAPERMDPMGTARERARLARTIHRAGLELASAQIRNLAMADALSRYLTWVAPLDQVAKSSERTSAIAVAPAPSGSFPDEESRRFRE